MTPRSATNTPTGVLFRSYRKTHLSQNLDPVMEDEGDSPQFVRKSRRSRTVPASALHRKYHSEPAFQTEATEERKDGRRCLTLPITPRSCRAQADSADDGVEKTASTCDEDESPGGMPIRRVSTLPARPRLSLSNMELQSPVSTPTSPTAAQLGALFDMVASGDDEGARMTLDDLGDAIVRLNSGFALGLAGDDAPRLLAYLRATADVNVSTAAVSSSSSSDGVGREAFVEGLRSLSGVLQRVGKSLSLREIKVVLRVAFEKYDLNDDGRIELDEFRVAARSMGVLVNQADLAVLHEFLTANSHNEMISQDDLSTKVPIWEQSAAMVQNGISLVQKKAGLANIHDALDRAHTAAKEPGSPKSRVQRAMAAFWNDGEVAQDAFELADFAIETSSLAIAAQYVGNCVTEAIQSHALHELDPLQIAPFLMFAGISAVNMSKHLDGLALKDMDENEALLFVQHFEKHGFSQAEFSRLLGCHGCRWVTAEAGEVLNAPDDNTLKFVVKGSAEVRSHDALLGDTAGGARMPLHATIGETLFLRGRRLWSKETIVAAERVTYLAWDIEHLHGYLDHHRQLDLRMGNLLAQTMSANLEVVSKLRLHDRGPTAGQLADMVSKDCSASPQSEASPQFWHRSRSKGTPTSYAELFHKMDSDEDGSVGRAELAAYLEYIDMRLGLGTSMQAHERLFAFLDVDQDGCVTEREFLLKMSQLEGCMKALIQSKVTMEDFVDVIRRSATQVDQDGDGSIDMQEFLAAARNLGLPLDVEQVIVLFSYLDTKHVGRIPVESLRLERSGMEALVSALQAAITSQIERKGLAKFGYFARQLNRVLDGPEEDIGVKAQQVLSTVWEGIDSVVDAATCTTDVVGMACAVFGIWQELEGFTTVEDLDMSNVCSLLVLMGISGVQMARHMSEGQVSDLSEREALLYTQTFEQHGFTVSEFQKLLTYGKVRWERHEPGEAVAADARGDLWIVVQGNCEVWDRKQHHTTQRIESGMVCGGATLLQTTSPSGSNAVAAAASSGKARAVNTSTVAAFDAIALRTRLDRDENMEAKVRRAVAVSIADRLVDAYHAEPRIAG